MDATCGRMQTEPVTTRHFVVSAEGGLGDVHPWMFAYVGVVDHSYFAVTDREGAFRLPAGLPAGNYTVAAYHRKAGELRQRIAVRPTMSKSIDFDYEISERAAQEVSQINP